MVWGKSAVAPQSIAINVVEELPVGSLADSRENTTPPTLEVLVSNRGRVSPTFTMNSM